MRFYFTAWSLFLSDSSVIEQPEKKGKRKRKLKIHFVINFFLHFNSKHIKDQLKQIFILLRTYFSVACACIPPVRPHFSKKKKRERKEKLIFLFISLKNTGRLMGTEIYFIFIQLSCWIYSQSQELTPVRNVCE